MTVRPLRDRRYVVETDGGTYVVDLERRTCTCPDHAIRGSRCKHLRRVAIEVTEGRLPAPRERPAVCAVCGRRTFVPSDATGPQLCEHHTLSPGDLVRDRESGALLLVVRTTAERADEFVTVENRTVADYGTNRDYGGHEPVVEAVYLDADSVGDVGTEAVVGSRRRVYERGVTGRPAGERVGGERTTDDHRTDDDNAVTPSAPGFGLDGGRPRVRGKPYGFPASRLQLVQRGYLPTRVVDRKIEEGAARSPRSVEV